MRKLQNKSYQEIAKFCLEMAIDKNKKFLRSYFNSKKTQQYKMNQEDIELYLFIHYLLPAKQKDAFFGFIKNKLKKDNNLKHLFFIRDEEFYIRKLIRNDLKYETV